MNKHLKKYAKPLICLTAGVALLSGAVFANYENANGYSNYKNALKQLALGEQNYAGDIKLELALDGETIASLESSMAMNENGVSSHSKDYTGDGIVSETISTDNQNGWDITYRTYSAWQEDGNFEPSTNWDFTKSSGSGQAISQSDRDMLEKVINFGEVLADTVVGDLKNNFVLTDNTDDSKSYTVTLSGAQVPELVRSGVSVLVGAMKYGSEEYYSNLEPDNPDAKIWKSIMAGDDPYIKEATCDFTLDSEGRLTYNKLNGVLTGYDADGNTHDLTLDITINIRDYGSAQLESIDLSPLSNLNAKDANGNALTIDDLLSMNKQVTCYDDANNMNLYIWPFTDEETQNGTGSSDRMYIDNGVVLTEDEFYADDKAAAETNGSETVETYVTDNGSEVAVEGSASAGIIGGADGPTAVYVTE